VQHRRVSSPVIMNTVSSKVEQSKIESCVGSIRNPPRSESCMCMACGMTFTRRFSLQRHTLRFHNSMVNHPSKSCEKEQPQNPIMRERVQSPTIIQHNQSSGINVHFYPLPTPTMKVPEFGLRIEPCQCKSCLKG
jgi:Ca2+-dependent lipid-binding protein